MKALHYTVRMRIVAMINAGLHEGIISERLGVSRATVRRAKKEFRALLNPNRTKYDGDVVGGAKARI